MFGSPNRAVRVTRLAGDALASALDRKRVVVVGGTAGLGRAVALACRSRGARVEVVGRKSRDRELDFLHADLSRMSEAVRVTRELKPETVDVLLFTQGILAAPTRVESAEGIEMDMAVSTLSRAVMLDEAARSLRRGSAVFVMGMPGAGMKGDPTDLNSERKYSGGFGETHANTVAGNEALVHFWAAQLKDKGVGVFGLNPGLIPTGIRDSVHGGGLLGRAMEAIVGWMGGTPEDYAERIVPILVAPELPDISGTLFSTRGEPILPTPAFQDPAYVEAFATALRDLQRRALSRAEPPAAAAAAGEQK
jgi:NAD(P)-dependent dehydrogenase (short-subunit alcohol dehydrogenase family)